MRPVELTEEEDALAIALDWHFTAGCCGVLDNTDTIPHSDWYIIRFTCRMCGAVSGILCSNESSVEDFDDDEETY